MLMPILPEHTVSIKPSKLDPYPHTIFAANQGMLTIRLRLSGIDSVEILADQSETEAHLFDLWELLRPAVDVALMSHDRTGVRV